MAIITENIKVSGMTCGHCEMTVKNAVLSLGEGIMEVKADKNTAAANVTYDDALLSRQQIVAAINATEIYSAS